MSATPSSSASLNPATVVPLSELARSRLHTVIHRGHTSARTRSRAQALHTLGDGWSDTAVGDAFDVRHNTIQRVRVRFAEGGVDAVLQASRRRGDAAAC